MQISVTDPAVVDVDQHIEGAYIPRNDSALNEIRLAIGVFENSCTTFVAVISRASCVVVCHIVLRTIISD
jgi:hypothetical protein